MIPKPRISSSKHSQRYAGWRPGIQSKIWSWNFELHCTLSKALSSTIDSLDDMKIDWSFFSNLTLKPPTFEMLSDVQMCWICFLVLKVWQTIGWQYAFVVVIVSLGLFDLWTSLYISSTIKIFFFHWSQIKTGNLVDRCWIKLVSNLNWNPNLGLCNVRNFVFLIYIYP